jgi:ankyrin repeat protein
MILYLIIIDVPIMEHLNLSSLASLTSESLILKQLFILWDQSFSCTEGYTSFCKSMLSGTTKALGIFLIQYLVKNPDKILSFFRSLILKFIYRRLELKNVLGTKDASINKLLQKEINPKAEPSSSISLSGLPLYLTINGSYTVLEYCPFIHQKFMDDINKEADLESENMNIPNKDIKTQCRDITRKVFVPDTLFPSKNYLALDTIISNFFTVVNRTKMYKAQGILIDGEPGLGKSKSSDYLGSLNKYHEVYYVNLSLTSLLKKDFKSIIDEVLTKRNGSTIIYFDELDKYLDFYLEYSFNKQEEIEDFTEYKRRQKQEFLYQLLEVIETNIYEDGVVFIFCSNNFHTIFEDVNQVHFQSLKSRFAPIRFDRCDRDEIIKFIRFFNAKMVGTIMYYEEIDELIENIKDHISLTYRSVRHCHVKAGYNLEKFIEFINEYEPEMSPKMEDLKPIKKICMKKIIEEEKMVDKKEGKKEENKKEESKKEESKKEDIKMEEIKEEVSDIWTCAKEGDVNKVREILANGIDPDVVDPVHGSTALMWASQAGKLECVRELIRSGANVNIQNKNGSTALIFASNSKHLDCMNELVRSGADVNCETKDRMTALIYASRDGDLQCIQELIRLGADVNLRNKWDSTALMCASRYGNLQCVQELIRFGADVNLQNKDGNTVLTYACYSQNIECVEFFLKLGLDINHRAIDGSTPLMHAIRYNRPGYVCNPEIAKLLLDAGADPILPSESGYLGKDVCDLVRSYQNK